MRSLPFLMLLLAFGPLRAEVRILTDLPYRPAETASADERERCHLDLYLPETETGFPTLVWFHGGGLTEWKNDHEFTARNARAFARRGLAVANVRYRLSPRTPFPGYVEDAAAAVAWTRAQIATHGGDPARVFVGGHSAGAYLAAMIGLDHRFLQKHGLDAHTLPGLVLLSGQAMTHYTVRAERGIGRHTIVADEAAPIYHSRPDAPPLLILWAESDMPTRAEENAYFAAVQRLAGNPRVISRQITERDHGSIARRLSEPGDEVMTAILGFIQNGSASQLKP